MIEIRPFEPNQAEYEAAVAIAIAARPESQHRQTVAEMRKWDEEWKSGFLNQRYVAVERHAQKPKKIIGIGGVIEPWWHYVPGTYMLRIDVHPDYVDAGATVLLHDTILDFLSRREPRPRRLQARTREDHALAHFLRQQGYVAQMRDEVSTLDVAAFDAALFAGVEERLAAQGIKIYTLAELIERVPDWKRRLLALRWALVQDVPSVDPPVEPTMADFEETHLSDEARRDEAWFVAVDESDGQEGGAGEWVGYCNLWANDPTYKILDTGMTGVIRSYRRHGIATALKLRSIGFAQRHGGETIKTVNEENNPMFTLNLALGFKPQPASVIFEKKLTEETE